MASISIALNNRQFEILESSRLPDESLGLAAKRLLLSVLEPDSESSRLPAELSRLSEDADYQNHRLDRLEEIVDLCNPADPNRIDKLEERLSLLEQRLSILENRATPAPISPSRLPAATRRGA